MCTNDLRPTSRRRFLFIGCGALAALCTGCQGNNGEDSSTETAGQILAEQDESVPAGATQAITVEEMATLTPVSTSEVEPDGETVATVLPSVTAVPEGDAVPEATGCPKGLVNDPYPGKCRRYIDEDGSGYCDLSEVSV